MVRPYNEFFTNNSDSPRNGVENNLYLTIIYNYENLSPVDAWAAKSMTNFLNTILR